MTTHVKSLLLFISLNFFSLNLLIANEIEKEPSIPLQRQIRISIISVDTITLKEYNLYHFKYKTKHKTVKASFWAAKNDKTFSRGIATVELCRIYSMRSCDGKENLEIRGLNNGITIYKEGVKEITFEFSEFAISPTLRLCSTDN